MGFWKGVGRIGLGIATGGLSELAGAGGGKGLLNAITGRPESSGPVEIPGLYNRAEGAGYARRAAGMTGQPSRYESILDTRLRTPPRSPYETALNDRLTGPASFEPMSDAEKALVNQAYSGRQATFNELGIGASPGAQTSIAAAAAPTLAGLRQQGTENLFKGQALFDERQLAELDQLLKAGGIEQSGRAIDIDALLKAAEFGMPRVAQQSQGARKGLADYATTLASAYLSGG